MPAFDDEFLSPPARTPSHEVGQDLSRLSVDELGARIALLQKEIGRLQAEIKAKTDQKSAADQLFRR